jgi:gliding motility-associated-like protein
MKRVLLLTCLVLFSFSAFTQVDIELTVESAITNTTCDDVFSGPDILFEVNVENEGWVTYPNVGACFTALPNLQYSNQYPCQSDVPAQLEVCFQVFENDPIIPFGCLIDPSCLETICDNFDIPPAGMSATYDLELTGSSSGTLTFTIANNGVADHDLPCEAIDFGLLTRGDTLGDFTQGIYSNLCGTNVNEPNPVDEGGFGNQNGVWFEFTTDDDIGSLLLIQALSDPDNLGNPLDVEIGVYGSDNNACDGNLSLLSWTAPFNNDDAYLHFRCPSPNTTYFILIDGAFSAPGSNEGYFGIQVINIDVNEAPDLRCDALDLGPVPPGGSVGLDTMLANFCATGTGDPFSPNFVTQTSVWFQFQAPPSGHILIEATSDRLIDSIGIQLGVYRAFNGTCTGFFQHFDSQYTFEDLDESFELTCLFPGVNYYILLDGDGGNGRGIFDLTVSDAGDITPMTTIDTVICDGGSFVVGSSVYTEPGNYSDTLDLFLGCDSIVNTNLIVLDPVSINIDQTQAAIGLGGMNGEATASASGGTGNYTYEWCDGTIGENNTMLIGGNTCCITVTDDFGCMGDTCFVVDFITGIIPTFTADTLDCNGDEDGIITFSVMNGQAPYMYSWQNADNTINGNGSISAENELVTLPDLPAGDYSVSIVDAFFDTSFTVQILEPSPLVWLSADIQDGSCFNSCDGTLTVNAIGGVGGIEYEWSNMVMNSDFIGNLCAGSYSVTATDANGCQIDTTLNVDEPEEFIATVVEVSPVLCFGDSSGIATVETNGDPVLYDWSNGGNTATIENLMAGTYMVVVTNSDGCTTMATGNITEPGTPLTASIEIVQEVDCINAQTGILQIVPQGPGTNFTAQWSTGSTGLQLSDIGAGSYSATIANENGCTATADFELGEPSRIEAITTPIDITCLSGENGGLIQIDTVTGGTPPYEYSLDGVVFSNSTTLGGLFAGNYDVVVMDANGCEESFAETILPAPEFIVDISSNQDDNTLQLGDSILLTALGSSTMANYSWISSDSLKTLNGSSIFVSPNVTTTYFVEAIDTTSFCTASSQITIKVVKDRRVYIPNAFSPNDDGRNDTFYINTDNAAVEIKSFRIFSRNGSLVFEATNFTPNDINTAWDGTFLGEELNPAVFVYIAEIEFVDGAVEIFTGDVLLVK